MSLIPYRPLSDPGPKEIVDPILERRGGTLFNIDRMLLNSPPLAAVWNPFFRAVRTQLSLEPKLLELAVCFVAVLNAADYELHHHAPILLMVGGTQQQLDALQAGADAANDLNSFDARERAVLGLALEITRNVQVKELTLEAARAILPGPRQLVELIVVISAYNMVSRVLVATGVELD